jgi:four helix bundle protein
VVSDQWSVTGGQWSEFYLPINELKGSPMKVKTYQELIVWQKAMDLIASVYKVSRTFPREEVYALTSQIRRAAVSIASNIAEGQGRRTTSDFLRHLSIAYGSLLETETQLLIAKRLRYLGNTNLEEVMNQTAEVGRLLNGLMASLCQS